MSRESQAIRLMFLQKAHQVLKFKTAELSFQTDREKVAIALTMLFVLPGGSR